MGLGETHADFCWIISGLADYIQQSQEIFSLHWRYMRLQNGPIQWHTAIMDLVSVYSKYLPGYTSELTITRKDGIMRLLGKWLGLDIDASNDMCRFNTEHNTLNLDDKWRIQRNIRTQKDDLIEDRIVFQSGLSCEKMRCCSRVTTLWESGRRCALSVRFVKCNSKQDHTEYKACFNSSLIFYVAFLSSCGNTVHQ